MRAVSGKENKVKEYIVAEIKNGRLGGHVSQVLIPTEKVASVRGTKRVIKERNYLPGYVLKIVVCTALCLALRSRLPKALAAA